MERDLRVQINESQNTEFKQIWKDEYLKTTFYTSKKVHEGLNGRLNGTINGAIKEVYDYIQSNQGASAVDMENKLNIPLRTLQRWLKELKEKELIEYRGSKKTGGYFIKSGASIDG